VLRDGARIDNIDKIRASLRVIQVGEPAQVGAATNIINSENAKSSIGGIVA
jgi:hypothetical protein